MIEKLKEELTIEELREMAQDVNSWDGELENLDYYENDEEFFEMFFADKVDEAVRAVCYGNYNYTDSYVRFNAYGNLDSCDEWEYQKEIENSAEEIINAYLDNIEDMWDEEIKNKIKSIMEEYDE